MSVEAAPLGFRCNLACTYCYEHPLRDAANLGDAHYELEAMKAALAAEGANFSLFGGEPLLVPLADLEALWRFGLERWGQNGIQTNGALVTPEHVDLFRRYKVHVGFSIDGPGELNDARWAGSLERTRAATERSLAALAAVREAGVAHSLIVTLHRLNASRPRLPRLVAWLAELDAAGLTTARLHLLQVDRPEVAASLELSLPEQLDALGALARAEAGYRGLRFDVFTEVRRLLTLECRDVTCIWNACDPYTTAAVHGVDGQGHRSNCGRVSAGGVRWLKGEQVGRERQLALYLTPQAAGGCKGCRFFAFCKGNCPGTAIAGDWRNRSAHCAVWMALFEMIEAELPAPASRRPDLARAEAALLAAWARGEDLPAWRAFEPGAVAARAASACGHEDVPHEDWHEDHTDAGGAHDDLPHEDWHLDGDQVTGKVPVGRPR